MEKKKIIILIIIVFLIGMINLAQSGKAYEKYLHYFNVDKDIYYNDETIHINASWNLDYNPIYEDSYIYIIIRNASGEILWQSDFYDQIGDNLTEEWEVEIQDLNIPINITSYYLSICFYWYWAYGTQEYDDPLDILEVYIVKRNVRCELIDFNPNLKLGEELQFKARFHFDENSTNLINYIITVKLRSENLYFYEKNYTTDSFGVIEINITISENLTVGEIILLFEIIEDQYFYGTQFEFKLSIEPCINEDLGSKNPDSEDNDDRNIITISLILSVLSISFLAIFLIYHTNLKRSNGHNLADLTFKY